MVVNNKYVFNFTCPQAGFKNEAKFTTWFGGMVKKFWWHRHKISDMSREIKPYDWVVWLKWYCWAIEIKFDKHKTWFHPFRLLRGASLNNPGWQVKWLWDYEKNGWQSFVCVYNKSINDFFLYKFGEIDFNTFQPLWEEDT